MGRLWLLLLLPPGSAGAAREASVAALVGDWDRFHEIEALGPEVLPPTAGSSPTLPGG